MPGGDGRGPLGEGSRTGRGAGFCSGSGQAGFVSAGGGRGFARRRVQNSFNPGFRGAGRQGMGFASQRPLQPSESEAGLADQVHLLRKELALVQSQLDKLLLKSDSQT